MFADDKKYLNGYMTTEAAFIVPITIFVIVWLIYVGFFQYDRCLIFQDDYSLAVQCGGIIGDKADKQQWLNNHIFTQIGRKYPGTYGIGTSAEVSNNKVKVTSKLSVNHPLKYHAGIIPDENWKISDEVNADLYSFAYRLRIQRGIMTWK